MIRNIEICVDRLLAKVGNHSGKHECLDLNLLYVFQPNNLLIVATAKLRHDRSEQYSIASKTACLLHLLLAQHKQISPVELTATMDSPLPQNTKNTWQDLPLLQFLWGRLMPSRNTRTLASRVATHSDPSCPQDGLCFDMLTFFLGGG